MMPTRSACRRQLRTNGSQGGTPDVSSKHGHGSRCTRAYEHHYARSAARGPTDPCGEASPGTARGWLSRVDRPGARGARASQARGVARGARCQQDRARRSQRMVFAALRRGVDGPRGAHQWRPAVHRRCRSTHIAARVLGAAVSDLPRARHADVGVRVRRHERAPHRPHRRAQLQGHRARTRRGHLALERRHGRADALDVPHARGAARARPRALRSAARTCHA